MDGRKISPFYRTSSPIRAAAQKAKYENEISVSFDESEAVPMTIEIPIEAQKVRPLGPAPQGAPWSLLVVH